jgi:ammonia channel protein AmtB
VQHWIVISASVAALLGMLVSLAVVDARMLPAAHWTRSVLLSLACAATGAAAWLIVAPVVAPQAVGGLLLPLAALGGVATYLATISARAGGGGVLGVLLFGLLWSGAVFVPTATMTFSLFASTGPLGLEPVDHGGSLGLNVAAGAAALGVLLSNGDRAPRLRTATLGRGAATVGVVVLAVSWLAWLVSAELAVDDATPAILLNGIVGALGGIGGWIAVQRIRHQSSTLASVAAGLVSGLVAVTAGAPLFTPVSAAVAGILAGGAACLFTLGRVRATRRQQWFVVGSHLVAGAIGLTLLGVLATGMGYMFTGDTGITFTGIFSFFEREVLSTLLVAVYSAAVSFALWSVIRRLTPAVVR